MRKSSVETLPQPTDVSADTPSAAPQSPAAMPSGCTLHRGEFAGVNQNPDLSRRLAIPLTLPCSIGLSFVADLRAEADAAMERWKTTDPDFANLARMLVQRSAKLDQLAALRRQRGAIHAAFVADPANDGRSADLSGVEMDIAGVERQMGMFDTAIVDLHCKASAKLAAFTRQCDADHARAVKAEIDATIAELESVLSPLVPKLVKAWRAMVGRSELSWPPADEVLPELPAGVTVPVEAAPVAFPVAIASEHGPGEIRAWNSQFANRTMQAAGK